MACTIGTMRAERERNEPPPQDHRPVQHPTGAAADSSRETTEEAPERRERRRAETLPPLTTGGGLPSEPGWMRP